MEKNGSHETTGTLGGRKSPNAENTVAVIAANARLQTFTDIIPFRNMV
jgi:hypothetical protein